MEWIETTGRSVEEAKEAALDELGVDEVDAEFQVLAEAQTGLFGRLRTEARVRARVRPTAPRSKDDRRDRRRRSSATQGPARGDDAAGGRTGSPESRGPSPSQSQSPGRAESSAQSEGGTASGRSSRRRRRSGGNRPAGVPDKTDNPSKAAPAEPRPAASAEARRRDDPEKGANVTEVALERQGELAAEFLAGLVTEFGLRATTTVTQPDEETVEVQLNGPDLGILIGPKGATLVALQSLARTVVFNHTGANNGHVNVDVGGYRQKRTEALARFATQVAGTVKQTGQRTALEPMSAVDRKVVHDTISSIDGVSTMSEGEEPRRRVVVVPD